MWSGTRLGRNVSTPRRYGAWSEDGKGVMSLDSCIDISGTVKSLLSIKGDHENVEVGMQFQCDDSARLCSGGLQGGDRGERGESDSEASSDMDDAPS